MQQLLRHAGSTVPVPVCTPWELGGTRVLGGTREPGGVPAGKTDRSQIKTCSYNGVATESVFHGEVEAGVPEWAAAS
eukprot:SAG11_NODE_5319_length_1597_cov_1.843124_1_plen_77_part_00